MGKLKGFFNRGNGFVGLIIGEIMFWVTLIIIWLYIN